MEVGDNCAMQNYWENKSLWLEHDKSNNARDARGKRTAAGVCELSHISPNHSIVLNGKLLIAADNKTPHVCWTPAAGSGGFARKTSSID